MIGSLKNAFGILNLNIVSDDSVNFLDLNIKFNNLTRKLEFTPYFKPTNTFSYLLNSSNHPDYIFKNIPKSLFIRLRRICSFYSDFIYYSSVLKRQLIFRGYEARIIDKTFNMVSNLERSELLKYKSKNNFIKNDSLFFKINFDKNILNFRNIFEKAFSNIFANKPNF